MLPAGEPLLAPHLRPGLRTITFGDGGDVRLRERLPGGRVLIEHDGEPIELQPSFAEAHNLGNLLAAVAAARALGYTPAGRLDVEFSAMRGQRELLAGGVTLIDDCYNANPMSMTAAIDELAESGPGRRVAVLGDMLELGPRAAEMHRALGEHARARGVELLVAVGPLASAIAEGFGGEAVVLADAQAAARRLGELVRDGDTVLVKASRGVGLERAADAVRAARERQDVPRGGAVAPQPPVPSPPTAGRR